MTYHKNEVQLFAALDQPGQLEISVELLNCENFVNSVLKKDNKK